MTTARRANAPEAALIAAAVEGVSGVRRLHGGRIGEFVTFGPHRRVVGVRVRDDRVTVAVTVRYPVVVADVAAAVRAALPGLGVPVDVVIADIEAPAGRGPEESGVDIPNTREETP